MTTPNQYHPTRDDPNTMFAVFEPGDSPAVQLSELFETSDQAKAFSQSIGGTGNV